MKWKTTKTFPQKLSKNSNTTRFDATVPLHSSLRAGLLHISKLTHWRILNKNEMLQYRKFFITISSELQLNKERNVHFHDVSAGCAAMGWSRVGLRMSTWQFYVSSSFFSFLRETGHNSMMMTMMVRGKNRDILRRLYFFFCVSLLWYRRRVFCVVVDLSSLRFHVGSQSSQNDVCRCGFT